MEVNWLINGEAGARLDPADRGLAYGDGLFETMAVRGGRVPRLELHLERLFEGCDRLAMPRPARDALVAEIDAATAGLERAVAKLIVTRGAGGRGYRPPEHPEPARILGIFPWPDYDASHYTRGIVLSSLDAIMSENAQLAGLKHLCRLEQVLAQLELARTHADEGIVRRSSGQIVGATTANLFAVHARRVLTPPVERCGVRGVMRRVVLEACERLGIESAETELVGADLESAEELFVTNAVAGIRPVRELDGRRYEVGSVTRALINEADAED